MLKQLFPLRVGEHHYSHPLRAGDICILVYLKGRNAAVGKVQ